MNTSLKYLVLGILSISVSGVSLANEDSFCPPPNCGGMMGGNQNERGDRMRGPDCGKIPEEIRTRMESLRKDREQIADLWQKAVLSRDDKDLAVLREEFSKTNADLIARVKKNAETIREDMNALREGFIKCDKVRMADNNCDAGEPLMDGKRHMNVDPMFDNDDPIKNAIDAEIVAKINALKTPLTAALFARITREVISSHRDELSAQVGDIFFDRMGGPPGIMPPMMTPELSRMRDAMRDVRDAPREDRRELRAQIREAMKIKDQAAREAAIKKIVDGYQDKSEVTTDELKTPPSNGDSKKAPTK